MTVFTPAIHRNDGRFESLSRRTVLKQSVASMVALSTGSLLSGCHLSGSSGGGATTVSNIGNIGPLSTTPDANGFFLPDGFTSRLLAKTDTAPLAAASYVWHDLPDGGATFATPEGGWIYVSNSESDNGLGGVGALEFAAAGDLIDAFQLLSNTSTNCAGGLTPWGTWLSCEEVPNGTVWETYPLERGQRSPVQRTALGVFQHEAAAVDPATGIVYLTEDQLDGCLYRFIPDSLDDLSSGTLQAAVVDPVDASQIAQEGTVTWVTVPDPTGATLSTRAQAQQLGAAIFVRGEGAWFHAGVLYISTTVDAAGGGLVWAYTPDANAATGVLTQIYNRVDLFPNDTTLNGVDNITVSAGGDVLVAEDSDNMQIQALTPDGKLVPLFQLEGQLINNFFPGEITGPAFDPSGTRLYFSSQRGSDADFQTFGKTIGATYEISGPFVTQA